MVLGAGYCTQAMTSSMMCCARGQPLLAAPRQWLRVSRRRTRLTPWLRAVRMACTACTGGPRRAMSTAARAIVAQVMPPITVVSQWGSWTSTASGQAHLQGFGRGPADVHPQGGACQQHTPAGQGCGNGPHASLGRAQSVCRLQVAQDVDQQPGIEVGAPEHLHVLGRKRAQDGGQRASGQVGHGGVAGYRDETSHMPSWTATGRGRHSEPAACG